MADSPQSSDLDTTFHTVRGKPETIGKYEIIKEVGKGTMGTVYKAHDPFMDKTVAIKLAHSHFTHDEQEGERFRKLFFNEAHAAGLLDHPSILTLHDADIDGEYCFLVMEYVSGAQTLQPFCKSDNLLPLREVVGILFKCAKALDYAHRQGIIHRDIKPSNILFTRDRDIRLSDFSIARINRTDQTSTQFDGFMGSPIYMSPEQINEWDVNTNTDIFSLGTVMYEMLTGHHPFRTDTLAGITHKITHESPPSLSEYRADLPEGLEYILNRMLRKKASKRYSSGLDLATDLALIFDDMEKLESEDSLRNKFDSLKRLGFFRGFNDAEIWSLVRASNWRNYSLGDHIIREGENDNSFYILLAGVVDVDKGGQKVGSLKEGDCFGEMGFLSQIERTASVTAKTETSIIKLNASTLNRADESTQLRFLKVFAETVIKRLRQTTSAMIQLRQL